MDFNAPLHAVSVTLCHCWHERDVGEGIDGGGQVKVEARADSGSLISIVVELVNGVGRREGRDSFSFCRCCCRALRPWTRFGYSSSGKTLPEIRSIFLSKCCNTSSQEYSAEFVTFMWRFRRIKVMQAIQLEQLHRKASQGYGGARSTRLDAKKDGLFYQCHRSSPT